MSVPNLRALVHEYRRLFRLDKAIIEVCYSNLSADQASGITYTHQHTRRKGVTIFLSHNLKSDWVLPVLLHELIHAEQFVNDEDMDHGAFFRWRVQEILAAGLSVVDHTGARKYP